MSGLEVNKIVGAVLAAGVLAMGVGFYLAIEVGRFEATEVLITGAIILKVVKNMATVQRHYQNAVLLESPYYAVEQLIEESRAEYEDLHGGVVPDLTRSTRSFPYSIARLYPGRQRASPSQG